MSLESVERLMLVGLFRAHVDDQTFAPYEPPDLDATDLVEIQIHVYGQSFEYRNKRLDESFALAMQGDIEAVGQYMAYARGAVMMLLAMKSLQGNIDEVRAWKIRRRVRRETALMAGHFLGRLSDEEKNAIWIRLSHLRDLVENYLGRLEKIGVINVSMH